MFHLQRQNEKEERDAAHDTLNLWQNQQGVRKLDGQTTKQPTVWRCQNPDCLESSLDRFYEFERDEPTCPKCGLTEPAVIKKALIHFLIRDSKGPIRGDMGMNFRMACSPMRAYIATTENGEAGTGDISAATCPGCLKTIGDPIRS